MSIPGLLFSDPVKFSMLGRSVITAALRGMTITGEHEVRVAVLERVDDDIADALFEYSSEAGEVLVLDAPGYFSAEVAALDLELLNAQRLYRMVVRLLDVATDTCVFVQSFSLIPVLHPIAEEFQMPLPLSTRFVNTLPLLGEEGGNGYLDGVTTLGQTVPCQIQFVVGNNPPELWILETGTEANEAGVYRRGLDYSVSNQKRWRRIS
jgi:hypothetical protein